MRHTKLLRVFRTISGTTLTALLLLRQGQSRWGSYRACCKLDAIVLRKLAYHLSACAGKRTISSVESARVVDNMRKQVMRDELFILLLNAHVFWGKVYTTMSELSHTFQLLPDELARHPDVERGV
jgi:hypothetical protein